jgi:c-di-AMP phosphodiesterase-like protein
VSIVKVYGVWIEQVSESSKTRLREKVASVLEEYSEAHARFYLRKYRGQTVTLTELTDLLETGIADAFEELPPWEEL